MVLSSFIAVLCVCVFFFKQKTAYEMRISDWSSDVCSSDLPCGAPAARARHDMVEGQFVRGQAFAAILAGETVAQKNVEPCEGRPALLRYIFLEGDDARQP